MIKDTFNLKEWLPDAREKYSRVLLVKKQPTIRFGILIVSSPTRLRSLFSFPDSLSVGDRLRAVNRSLSFTFVRHPFVRLISAFQVKSRMY